MNKQRCFECHTVTYIFFKRNKIIRWAPQSLIIGLTEQILTVTITFFQKYLFFLNFCCCLSSWIQKQRLKIAIYHQQHFQTFGVLTNNTLHSLTNSDSSVSLKDPKVKKEKRRKNNACIDPIQGDDESRAKQEARIHESTSRA